ncbi:hypothetical protein N7517_000157 [Penicillium concentricum]|uniref:Cytochrome P450 n=1 Tax=Penicillium concentricum TaxID=293559 RepID=A0A9W9SPF6_9EURO|nr:uncharacterized protein N7517_000157 [Penicillium concentricum]KAJ5382246.1 hypothetical protein N7517_000157 [Penicillium concentricum]
MGLTARIFDAFQNSHIIYVSFSKVSPAVILNATNLVVIAICSYVFYQAFLSPLARFPGPVLAKFTGLWRSYHYWRGTWHDDILKLHNTYGRAVRIAPNELSLVDAEAIKQLYSHGHHAKKTKWYSVWDVRNAGANVFSTQDNKEHAFLRKRLSGAYSMTSILKFEQYIQSCLDLFMIQMQKHVGLGKPVNMSEWTNMLAFDVVGELAYGSPLGQLESGTDTLNIRSSIYQYFQWGSNLGHFPGQISLLQNPFASSIRRFLGLADGPVHFQRWSSEQVRKRQEGKNISERKDMLYHFINMKGPDGAPASHGEILMETLNIVGAGADTTSIGMRSTLHYICLNPERYARLQEEIDTYYKDNTLTSPITYTDTLKLPYLCAVVKEATRLLPSIVYQLLRHVPEQGLMIDGKSIPPGTPVGVSPIAQNRDQAIWGADADIFRPERWLEDEQMARRYEVANMTFGGNGPRMCIGRNIALVEIHKFIAQLLRNFDVELVNLEVPWRITSVWFAFQHDMNVILKPRTIPCG